MRKKAGDFVEIFNGKGELAQAEIEKVEKRSTQLFIHKVISEPPPSFRIIIAQAIPRFNRLDFITEKATELGMTDFWLFPGMLSEKKEISTAQKKRIDAIAVAACKQCGRLYLPNILFLPPLNHWKIPRFPLFYGDLSPHAIPFAKEWQKTKPTSGVVFCVGPEAGFAEKELKDLKHLKGHGVKLHSNILRTDTAPITALSLIGHWLLS